AGTAPNVIPERAKLTGTIRAVDPATRQLLKSGVAHIAESTASAYGVKAEVVFDDGTPPIVNRSEPVQWARQAVRSLLGEDALVPLPGLNMVGEDFAYYLETIQGCFLRVGACEEGGKQIPSHSPYFYAAEETIFVGAAVLAETARRASAALASAS
ncbi:MAG: M20/M25/M40 family metallo-hydrolase, partial [Bacteroidota bacterium]